MNSRISSLNAFLRKHRFDGCVVANPIDLLYLTGLNLSTGSLYLIDGEACLFVDGRYLQIAQEKKPCLVALTSDENIRSFVKKNKLIVFDSEKTSYEGFLKLKKFGAKLKPVPNLLKELRAIKDEKELKRIRKSAALLWKGFEHVKKYIKTGVSEKELALEFELFCRKHGAEKLAFDSIFAFGAASAMPHHRAGTARLKKGDVILIDIGIVVDGYHSDMTRVLFWGKPDPRIKKLYSIVRKSQKAALKICRPGMTVGMLDEAARKVMKEEKVEQHFIHSLGHGVGLEIHEYPRVSCTGNDSGVVLKPGMVITIEPGLYLPGIGGVRYEDTVIVTEKGCKNLYPKEGSHPWD